MKKLLILTAVLMLGSSAVGCRCCDWMFRGAGCNPGVPAAYSNPCPPYNPCDPCATSPTITPGPTSYSSTPAG